jgi:hypothetical protein
VAIAARKRIEMEAASVLGVMAQQTNITLAELSGKLREHATSVEIGTLWRSCQRHRVTLKEKIAHASEQERADVKGS